MNGNRLAAGRLPGLDTLRALAIAWVLMTHYDGFVSRQQTFGVAGSLGWAGVDLFFVLSGYLVGRQVAQPLALGTPWSAGRFIARRLLRTLPDYLAVLLVYGLFPGAPLGGSATAPPWRFLTFTQNFGLAYGETFTHSWSLCVEEQFYALLPLAALAWARWGRSPRAAWAAVAGGIALGILARGLAFSRHGFDAFDAPVYYSTFCRIDEFLPGVALAMLEGFHPRLFAAARRHGHASSLAGLLSSAAVLYCMANDLPSPFLATALGFSLLAIAFSFLVLAALSPASLLHRFRVPGAASLALWSYAVYLVHKPFFMAVAPVLAHRRVDATSWPVVVTVVACGVAAGWLLFRTVETPFMRLRARWFPGRPSDRPPGAAPAADRPRPSRTVPAGQPPS